MNLDILEELEVGVSQDEQEDIKTNEEVVGELQYQEKELARMSFELEKQYPIYEVRLTPESQISSVTMDAIKSLVSVSVQKKKEVSDFVSEAESGEKELEVCMTLVLAVDPEKAPVEKVVGYFKKEKLRHLYQLTRNLEQRFYLDKDRVFSGQKILAVL